MLKGHWIPWDRTDLLLKHRGSSAQQRPRHKHVSVAHSVLITLPLKPKHFPSRFPIRSWRTAGRHGEPCLPQRLAPLRSLARSAPVDVYADSLPPERRASIASLRGEPGSFLQFVFAPIKASLRAERGEPCKFSSCGGAVSCRSSDRSWWRTELDLSRGKSFEDHHRSATTWATPKRVRFLGGGFWLDLRRKCAQCCEAKRQ